MAFAAPSPLLACPSLRRRAIQHPPALPRRHPLAAATTAGPAIATVLTAAVTAVAVVVAAPVAALPSRRPSQSRAVSTIVPPRTILSRVAATLLSPRAALLRVLAVLLSPRAARSVAAALLGVATAVTAGWFHPRVAMAGPHGRAPPPREPPPVTRRSLGRRLASTAVTFAAGAAVGVTAVALPRATARYRDAADIPPAAFPAATAPFGRRAAAGGAVLSAFVTDVADGDTLRVRHTPLRLPGSDANDPATYFARRALPRSDPNALPRGAEETLPVRLAGVDCPEVEHFGKPGQPLGETAKRFVEDLLVTHGGGDPGPDGNSSSSSKKAKRKGPCRGAGAAVRLGLLSRDQYGRLVATMWVGPPWAPVNVSAALLTAGLAVIYRGAGAVDGGWGAEYERLEADAKARGVGVWGTAGGGESPSEYKARMRSGG